MTQPRRRVLRNSSPQEDEPQRQKKIARRREKLEKEQESLSKWKAKLLCGVGNYAEFQTPPPAR